MPQYRRWMYADYIREFKRMSSWNRAYCGLWWACVLATTPPAAAQCVPSWDGTIGNPGLNQRCQTLYVADLGKGDELYIGGDFSLAGGIEASGIVKWDGESWTALGSGLGGNPPRPRAMVQWDDGSGPALYVGGDFTMAGGTVVNHIAKWDGNTWHTLNGGVVSAGFAPIRSLDVFDDGSGEALYVAGNFSSAGGTQNTAYLARWDGANWSEVGETQFLSAVSALVLFDNDGSGPALVASGPIIADVGGMTALAKWDGEQWTALADWPTPGFARAGMVVWDDGTGPALYIGGDGVDSAGDADANMIARWDGTTWSNLDGGLTVGELLKCRSLAVFNDGTGEALYAGGRFQLAGSVPANNIAKWDGNSWSALDSGTTIETAVRALAVYDAPNAEGPALYVGGSFNTAGGLPVHSLASWEACAPGDLNGDGYIGTVDLLILLAAWGPCSDPCPPSCPADFDGDCAVSVSDFLTLLANWG